MQSDPDLLRIEEKTCMDRPTNIALKVAGIALTLGFLGGALAGCGGSDGDEAPKADASKADAPTSDAPRSDAPRSDAPKDVSTEDFCEQFLGLAKQLVKIDIKDPAESIARIKEWAAGMEDYGTPSEMTDEVRQGMEVVVSRFVELPADATAEELQTVGADLSAEDSKATQAFGTWTGENCPQQPDISAQ
ncbi:hypothetical protein GCM10023350_34710 [Nocardioides endophyticus]|uniref:DUF732 domain-containing protein n=1 Tax=Nocardioides endophyticus TaxID=1353775 RepID=A0ABP8Z5B8_9ACTN